MTIEQEQEVVKYYEYIVNKLFPEYFNSGSNQSFTLYYIQNNILHPYFKSLKEEIKENFDFVDYIVYGILNDGFFIMIRSKDKNSDIKEDGYGDTLGKFISNYLGLPYNGYYVTFNRLVYEFLKDSDKYKQLVEKVFNKLLKQINEISIPNVDKDILDEVKRKVLRNLR